MARETRNILVNRIVDRAIGQAASRARGRLLDIGCGTKPYEHHFAPYVSEYVGLDHEQSAHGLDRVDIVGTAYEIPVPDESFDTILCTAVLEHLEEPGAALGEARRVLRPTGTAIYVAPLIWHLHEEPRDFFRYTKHGLSYLFRQAGFEIEEIRPLAGFWVSMGQAFVYYLFRFNRGILRRARLVALIGLAVQGLVAVLDRVDRAEEWSWAYLVIATRENRRSP